MASKAHIAVHGTKKSSFQAIADFLSEKLEFSVRVDLNIVLDRYERMQKDLELEDKLYSMKYGVDGEV